MALANTEAVNANAKGLDLQPPMAILRLLAEAQVEAAKSAQGAVEPIARAAEIAASRLASGGRLFYAAAGSSALMALADALELPGTYGMAPDRIVVLLAGGRQALVDLAGAPEDDAQEVVAELRARKLGRSDCLVALSASGTTPYAVAALEEARRSGAATVGMANNAGTPLVTAGRRRHRIGDAAGNDRRLDADGRRHGAEDRAQYVLDSGRHPPRPCA